MNKYKKLGKNIALITIGSFASKVLSFFLIPFYTSVLTTNEYGTADLMTTTVNLISPFFTLLISEAIMRYALDRKVDKKQVFTIGVFVTIVGFFIMLIFSPILLMSQELKSFYILFILYYFVTTLHMVISQFVKGIEKVTIYSLSGVFQTLIFIMFNLVFLLGFKIGVIGYLLSLILSNFFTIVFLWIGAKLNDYVIALRKIDRGLFKSMCEYSIPMIPNSISWWISNSSDKYILTFFFGVSLTGIYSVSQKIPSLFATISAIFMGAWQISAVEDFGSKQSCDFYTAVYRKYSSLNNLIVAILILMTKFMAYFLFSKDFYEAWMYTPVLLFAFLFNSMSAFLGSIYTSSKKTKMLFISTIVAAVSNIIVNLFMIPKWGGMGAALATLISYFIVWLIRIIDTKNILKIDIEFRKDIMSYFLIVCEIIILCLEVNNYFIWMSVCVFILILIQKNFIKEVVNMIFEGIEKLIHKC